MLALTWTVGVVVLWLVVGRTELDDAQLLLDPAALAGLPWYTGLISNIGILAWTLATAAAAGAAHVARLGGRHGAARFLRQAAVLSLLLTLDDLFLLHSSAFPKAFGVPKPITLIAYAWCGLAWVVGNRHEVARTRWGLLVAAGAAIATSVAIDRVASTASWTLLAEDGAKFLGVLAWAAYFTLTATDIATSVVKDLATRHPVAGDQPREPEVLTPQ